MFHFKRKKKRLLPSFRKYMSINLTSFYAYFFPIELLPSEYEIGCCTTSQAEYFFAVSGIANAEQGKINARKTNIK